MSADEFRELALSFSGATESAHMHHPDFRANGKIFATLGYPNDESGMVKLTPSDQQRFCEMHPQIFTPVKGAWGVQGSTTVHLKAAKPDVLASALELAWQQSAVAPAKKARRKTR